MDTKELISHTQRILQKAKNAGDIYGSYTEACELVRMSVGEKSSFSKSLQLCNPFTGVVGRSLEREQYQLESILNSFLQHLESGLHQEISPERQAQLDVVSDFLEMANSLLEQKDVHPSAPAVLIGATLEEFLRTWIETESLPLGNRKPGLETYSQVLRDTNLITKQDGKDITSWSGIRNHAAHGEWNEVSDRNKVSLMLQGVNLFMRKYSR